MSQASSENNKNLNKRLPKYQHLDIPELSQVEREELALYDEVALSQRSRQGKKLSSECSKLLDKKEARKLRRVHGRVSYRQGSKNFDSARKGTNKSEMEFEQMGILDSMDHSIKVAKSNAKLCTSGIVIKFKTTTEEELFTCGEICADKKEIKFELSPKARKNWQELRPEQKNILQAARSNNVDYIRQMIETHFATEFNFQDKNGNTPLYEAVVAKNVEIVKLLVKKGANINTKCENGNTCLHRIMLCKDGDVRNERIINILLNNGMVTRKQFQTHQQFN